MKEQRERAKADAQAKKTGHADLSAYREVADSSGATEFTGYTDTEGESTVVGLLVDGVSSPGRHRGRRGRGRPRPHPVLRRGRRPARRHRAGSGSTPAPSSRSATSSSRCPASSVHKGVVQVGEVTVGAAALRRRSTSTAAGPSPAPTAPPTSPTRRCATPSARRPPRPVRRTQPGRFRFDFGSPAAVPGTVLTDVEQKINEVLARELDVTRRGDEHRRGQEAGRHRRVRREVRRAGPRRHHRRLLQGAVRRHARRTTPPSWVW